MNMITTQLNEADIGVSIARLLCTDRGTGTQYSIASDSGAPILLRGTLWPADPPNGLRCRSLPIKRTGETRLVLVLDPVSDPENET